MTDWPFSAVLIVPAALREAANRLSCALGYDEMPGSTYSVPLSINGQEPASHFGCRSQAKQEFVDILGAAGQGVLPGDLDLTTFDLTPADVRAIVAALICDVRPAEAMAGHFDAVAEAHGLVRVLPQEDAEEA